MYIIFNVNNDKQTYKAIEKEKLFEAATQAMDNYNKAVEMGLDDFANYYYCQMRKLLQEIKSRGLKQEFDDFALVF